MRSVLAACAAALLASCATATSVPSSREQLTRQIADDAVAFNEAYAQAVSAQILLNILRSRDRLPRYYLAMTGISDSPSSTTTRSAALGDIQLGDIGSPWGVAGAGVSRENATRPSYAVQPFDAQTLTRTAFSPTPPHVFEHYWRSGWPRDLLLLMMVEQIEKTDGNNHTHVFVNEANTIFEDCPESVRTEGCDFVREVRDFMITDAEHPRESGIDRRRGRPLCGLIDAYGPTTPIRPVEPAPGLDCDPVFAVGQTTIRLRLRSLDDMVYYVGELLRADSTHAELASRSKRKSPCAPRAFAVGAAVCRSSVSCRLDTRHIIPTPRKLRTAGSAIALVPQLAARVAKPRLTVGAPTPRRRGIAPRQFYR